ncbi:hypothetical protein BD410DRAFT_831078 [Rickenella mellea]|uniref:Uncharacterized protein n=1 Tax=Rickenella mellea TaxID=50990 RepID=A0A4Y7PU51_9AGAM|nr:hypothetical protein BD410DRAFT_831078 [Rickenella mellea]
MSSKPVFGPVPPPQLRGDYSCISKYPSLRGLSKEVKNELLLSLANQLDPATSSEVGGIRVLEVTWFSEPKTKESHHAVWFGPRETPLLAIATAPWYHLCDNDITRPTPVVWAEILSNPVRNVIHEHGTVKPEQTKRFEEDFKFAYTNVVSIFPGGHRGCMNRFMALLATLHARGNFCWNDPVDMMGMLFPGQARGMEDWRSVPSPSSRSAVNPLAGLSNDLKTALFEGLSVTVLPSSSDAKDYRFIRIAWYPSGWSIDTGHAAIWFGPRSTPVSEIATAPWYHFCENGPRAIPISWATRFQGCAPLQLKNVIDEVGSVKAGNAGGFDGLFKRAYIEVVGAYPKLSKGGCLERQMRVCTVLEHTGIFIHCNVKDVFYAKARADAGLAESYRRNAHLLDGCTSSGCHH